MRVHDSQAYRKMDVTRERISRILELREILLSIQIGFSLVNAAVACALCVCIEWLSERERERKRELMMVMIILYYSRIKI